MRKLKLIKLLVPVQVAILLLVGFAAFQFTQVARAGQIGYQDLGIASLIMSPGHAPSDYNGHPTSMDPQLQLWEDQYRLFNVWETAINWNSTDASLINGSSDEYYVALHAFNYNTSCTHPNVTEAHDAYSNRLLGSTWFTNLPNASSDGDSKQGAGCGNIGDNNEIRFIARTGGNNNQITPDTNYLAQASFVDYNWPSSSAWVEVTYNFVHNWWGFGHVDADYGNSNGEKICVNGYDNVLLPDSSGACP